MTNNVSLSDDTRLDQIVDEFELAHCEGNPPAIEDILPPKGEADYVDVLIELLRVDMEHRWRAGTQIVWKTT